MGGVERGGVGWSGVEWSALSDYDPRYEARYA